MIVFLTVVEDHAASSQANEVQSDWALPTQNRKKLRREINSDPETNGDEPELKVLIHINRNRCKPDHAFQHNAK